MVGRITLRCWTSTRAGLRVAQGQGLAAKSPYLPRRHDGAAAHRVRPEHYARQVRRRRNHRLKAEAVSDRGRRAAAGHAKHAQQNCARRRGAGTAPGAASGRVRPHLNTPKRRNTEGSAKADPSCSAALSAMRGLPLCYAWSCGNEDRSNCPSRTPKMNCSHSAEEKTNVCRCRFGRCLSFESRSATWWSRKATSTQPFAPLRLLFRHTTRDRSHLLNLPTLHSSRSSLRTKHGRTYVARAVACWARGHKWVTDRSLTYTDLLSIRRRGRQSGAS